EAAFGYAQRDRRAERGRVQRAAEREGADTERQGGAEPTEIVALHRTAARRGAFFAACGVGNALAAQPAPLAGARRRAAVAPRRVAVVAFLADAHVAVAACWRRAVAVAVAGGAVERTVVALLAGIERAVAAGRNALALRIAVTAQRRVALLAAGSVQHSVA